MKQALIIFTRVPKAGETKTRLGVRFSKEECAEIHEAMLMDMEEMLTCSLWDTFVYYTPASGLEKIKKLLPGAVAYRPQKEEEFGARMNGCIKEVLENGYEGCVLVGTDIPVLDCEILRSAFEMLQDKDVVIGATKDAGYYLIGMKELHKEIFENQIYGTGSVYLDTLKKIRRCGCTYGELPVLIDIDEPEDIEAYRREYSDRKESMVHTWDYIGRLCAKYHL